MRSARKSSSAAGCSRKRAWCSSASCTSAHRLCARARPLLAVRHKRQLSDSVSHHSSLESFRYTCACTSSRPGLAHCASIKALGVEGVGSGHIYLALESSGGCGTSPMKCTCREVRRMVPGKTLFGSTRRHAQE